MSEPVRTVRDDELRDDEGTPGLRRRVAFDGDGHVVHREGNMSSQPGQVVLVRVGDGPVVFPADGPDEA